MSIDHEAVKADAERTRDGLGPIWASWVSDLALAYLDLAAQLEALDEKNNNLLRENGLLESQLEAARKDADDFAQWLLKGYCAECGSFACHGLPCSRWERLKPYAHEYNAAMRVDNEQKEA